MAILEKRRAVNQLPRFQRYQDTRAGDRAAALRGETPITSAIRQLAGSSGYDPMGESEGYYPMGGAGPMGGGMGGAGKGTVDKFGNMAGQPKNAVTSALKGSTAGTKTAGTTTAGTTSKLPGLTSKTTDATGKTLTSTGTGTGKTTGATGSTGSKTLTSTGSGTSKTTGTTGTTGAKTSGSSGSSLGKTITNALTGAALGAGTKFVIDKLTGKKTAVTGEEKTSGTSKSGNTGLTSKTNPLGGTLGKAVDKITTGVVDKVGSKIVDKVTGTDKNANSKTGLTSKTNPLGSNIGKSITDKAINEAAKKVTSPVKPKSPITSKTSGAGAGSSAPTADKAYAGTPADPSLGLPEGAIDNGDGTYTVGNTTYSMENDAVLYTTDADGTITLADTAGSGGTDDLQDGTTTQVMDDGTVVTLNADGDIVSYTDTDGVKYDANGDEISGSGGNDNVGGGNVVGGGDTTETLDDGTQITYDADGDVVSYTDTDGVTYNGDGEVIGGEDTTAGGGTRSIGGGNVTASVENNDGTTSVTYDDGSTAIIDEDGEIISSTESEDDGLFSDDEGNLYDANGDLVQYADGTEVGDDYSTEDEVAYTDEYGNTYDENGDLIAEGDYSDYVQYDEFGNSYDYNGELIDYAEGYEPDTEYSADTDYTDEDEYIAEDDYSYDDIDYGKNGGAISMAEGGSLDEPIDEKQNADGTITQMFDDGSSITYNQEGEVMKVSEAKGYAGGDLVDETGMISDYSINDETGELYKPLQTNEYGDLYTPVLGNRGYTSLSAPEISLRDRDQALMNSRPLTPLTSVDVNRPAMYTPPEGWPDGYVSNDDGTATYVYDDGSTITIDVDSNVVFTTDANGDIVEDNTQATTGGLTQAQQGIQYFDDGSYIQTFDDGTSITFDSEGNPFRATDNEGNSQLANTTTYDDEGNQTISDYYGNIVKVLDPQGNVIPLGGGRVNSGRITNAGGTGAVGTDVAQTVKDKIAGQKLERDSASAIDSLLAGLNTYGGAGAAGAVLGALLGDTDLFGGGGGGGSSFDMTGVGAIDPRTTDFGIGPANYVGYDQYGTPEQMPELYGRELYQNLNAPGFNEVNPGDYARYDDEEFGPDPLYEEAMAEEQGMAEGGMPQGGLGRTSPQTYYTFGKPVDPLQNLRNPTPFQPQQPQMPPRAAQNSQQAPQGMQPMGMPQMPQMPPMAQGMPQGMPPAGMKRGGLPALSNVPITQGRLNFRQGAAVHGPGDGQSDDIPAMLADGEYVIDAETVAQIGNGSTKAGAQALDKFRENIRMHKRSAPVNKIPPKTKALTSYLKGAR